MGDPVVTVGSVVINVVDMERAREFWSEVLGAAVAMELPGFLWFAPQHEGGISVALQQVDEPTPGRNRVHLDTGVSDIPAAIARIEALGGTHLEDHELGGFNWTVMADPEGNEFCIAVHNGG